MLQKGNESRLCRTCFTLLILRHSHQGKDLRYIQTLPGHRSSRATEICTHVT
ncbi:integrase [Pontibacter diazotrophicus]|uniref:Integrase n=1 Tax=Pontibacter diazotrophicus TaxID=1400979 RepID=A0A3D8L7J5_9BACT|nr:integrase [Pontibacter diazotrophicus]